MLEQQIYCRGICIHSHQTLQSSKRQKFNWTLFTNGFQRICAESDQNHFYIYMAHIRTVSALDVKQILFPTVGSLIVSWRDCEVAFPMLAMWANTLPKSLMTFQQQHALSEGSDPLHLSSHTRILLPSFFLFHADSLLCMLLQALESVMGLKIKLRSRARRNQASQ